MLAKLAKWAEDICIWEALKVGIEVSGVEDKSKWEDQIGEYENGLGRLFLQLKDEKAGYTVHEHN